MALSIVKVQESRVLLGEGVQEETFQFIPGTSDYVTNGYVITNILLGFAKIQSAWVSGVNATVTGPPTYLAFPVFVFAQVGSGGPGFSGYSQFLFQVFSLTNATPPVYGEVGSGANISGTKWEVTVRGF